MESDTPSETVLSRLTRAMVEALVVGGTVRAEVAEQAGLAETVLDRPLTEQAARRLWAAAPVVSRDPDWGLHFAELATLADLGITGYIARASATVGDACSRIVHLQRMLKDQDRLELHVNDGRATLTDSPRVGEPPWPRALTEAILASWVLWARRWVEGTYRLEAVWFEHERPPSTVEHARVFGCPLRFGATANQLVIPREVWDLPLQTSDALLARYLESAAVEEARRRRNRDPFMSRLERAIVDVMPSGELGAERVARAVGLSRRSLHRRLTERGLTYQALVDDLRLRTARSLLDQGDHSMTEVAFLVGFSDPSGLRRAFRRSTGAPPTATRTFADRKNDAR